MTADDAILPTPACAWNRQNRATSGSCISLVLAREVKVASVSQVSHRYVSVSSPREKRSGLRTLRAMGFLHFGHSASSIRSGIARLKNGLSQPA
jgi:hypothetical protein